ncbi:MAG: glycosyltransferase family 2 protein [Pirellulaceae bacterium]
MSFDVPIAFCFYNRPEQTQQVFSEIRNIAPRELLLISDGPNSNRAGDTEKVLRCREVVKQIDWDCSVRRCYSVNNLGCRIRMSSGLNWAFQHAESLIVLEDDCLPSRSFFTFCREALERYRDDESVFMVSGDRFLPTLDGSQAYRSKWAHIWGWASWSRAWQFYDLELQDWPQRAQTNWLQEWCDRETEVEHWRSVFDQVHQSAIDTWDYSWMYTLWSQNAHCVIPPKNLVTNIGFAHDATHTVDPDSALANLPRHELQNVVWPSGTERDLDADCWTFDNIFDASNRKPEQSWLTRWKRRLFGRAA